jgi:hypothetical protein
LTLLETLAPSDLQTPLPLPDFTHWPMDFTLYVVITNKIPLHNENCPITDPITEMGVAHTVGLSRIPNENILFYFQTLVVLKICAAKLYLSCVITGQKCVSRPA